LIDLCFTIYIFHIYISASAATKKETVLGSIVADECPYKNISASLTPGETTAKVLLLDGLSVEFPVGVHRATKEYNSRICIFHITVTSK